MKTHIHVSLSLEGALMNWKKRDYKNVLQDEKGKFLTPEETKRQFLQWMSEGKKVIPFASLKECPNFDYGRGCPGHPIAD